jgi:hypothetical protein
MASLVAVWVQCSLLGFSYSESQAGAKFRAPPSGLPPAAGWPVELASL